MAKATKIDHKARARSAREKFNSSGVSLSKEQRRILMALRSGKTLAEARKK